MSANIAMVVKIGTILFPLPAVITVLVYHLGCLIEFLMGVHDGARVFPVHAMG